MLLVCGAWQPDADVYDGQAAHASSQKAWQQICNQELARRRYHMPQSAGQKYCSCLCCLLKQLHLTVMTGFVADC